MTTQTIEEKVKWYSLLNKQNLNGRETEDELYEAGILVGIEETEELRDEFAIEFAEWLSEKERTKFQCKSYCKKLTMWFTDKKGLGATTKELLEQFKKEKGYE